jgi:hypothetical protein
MRNDFVVYVALSSAAPSNSQLEKREVTRRARRTSDLPCVPVLDGLPQNPLRLVALLEPVSNAEDEGIVRLDLDSVVGFVPCVKRIPVFGLEAYER